MSTSIISFVQNFSANDIEIKVFEFYLLSPATSWGGSIRNMVKKSDIFDNERIQSFYGFTFEFPCSRWRNDFRLILHFRLNHVFFAFQILMLRFFNAIFLFLFLKMKNPPAVTETTHFRASFLNKFSCKKILSTPHSINKCVILFLHSIKRNARALLFHSVSTSICNSLTNNWPLLRINVKAHYIILCTTFMKSEMNKL